MSSSATKETRRLFLALWPGERERQRMVKLTEAITEGRKVRPANLHLTLIFLGATTAERLACYEQALQGIEVPQVTLTLDQFGYRRKQRILWLSTSHTPQPLVDLVAELNQRLQTCGFTLDRRPFHAHVTLARKFPGPAPAEPPGEPLCWNVDQIVLVESVSEKNGVHYQVLRGWPAKHSEG